MSKFLFAVIVVLAGAFGAAVYYGFIVIPDWHKPAPPPATAVADAKKPEPAQAVCTGMVEAVGGEIDIFAQMPGELVELDVREGQAVQKGQVVAVVDARRQEAEIAVAAAAVTCAEAKLKRTEAGVGNEEKQEALFNAEALAALLKYEIDNRDRLRKLYSTKAISLDVLDASENQVVHLQKQLDGLRQHYKSLLRGPLPEEIELALAEVAASEQQLHQAKVNYEYRKVYAPADGTVLQIFRHAGDSVSIQVQTPIIRMVDASHLRIRLEIDEAYAPRMKPPREGTFQVGGVAESVENSSSPPSFPSSAPSGCSIPTPSARIDTRILDVLCEIKQCSIPLYPGQRITATIPLESRK